MTGPGAGPILGDMSEAPDNHELARQVAILEERMNTMQADLSAALERFRADMAARETRMLLAIAGMIGLAVAIIGFMV